MKYPCGKEFDPSLPVQLRAGNKARIICIDCRSLNANDNTIALYTDKYENGDEAESTAHLYNCGHRYSDHRDNGNDLINVPDHMPMQTEPKVEVLKGSSIDKNNKLNQIKYYTDVCINIQETIQRLVDELEELNA